MAVKINLDNDKKVATRESYGNALVELGNEHENLIVMDADLAGSTKTGTFKKAFPERHFNAGIAEGNMMAVAAGLASTGKVVFASSFAMFAAGRAYEQIRNAIAHTKLNVKVAASHAGITVGEDGATHQCVEDLSIMRTIPNMVVVCPSDDVEARAAIKAAYDYDGPMYIRLGRSAVPVFNDEETYKFELGKGVVMRDGKDVTLFATGNEVYETLKAARLLEADGIDAEVINIHTIKPIDEEIVKESLEKTKRGFTIEEHSIVGGLFSAVSEAAAKNCPTKITPIGINDCFGQSGPAGELLKLYGLDAESIYKKVKENI